MVRNEICVRPGLATGVPFIRVSAWFAETWDMDCYYWAEKFKGHTSGPVDDDSVWSPQAGGFLHLYNSIFKSWFLVIFLYLMVDGNRKPPVSSSQGLLAQWHRDLRREHSLAFRHDWGHWGCNGDSAPRACVTGAMEGAVTGGLVLFLQKLP